MIDPIDGTNNFVHGVPTIAISVAFVVNRTIVLGYIYNSILDELYSARLGNGSYLNGNPISCSKVETVNSNLYFSESENTN